MVAQGLFSQISSLGSILSVMALTVIFLIKHVGGFGADFFVIIIPIACPFSAPFPVIFMRVDCDAVPRPQAKTSLQPVLRCFSAIGFDRFT